MNRFFVRGFLLAAALVVSGLGFAAAAAADNQYVVHNLVSDGAPSLPADQVDPSLVNAWGLVSAPTSPWWVADNGTSISTLYNASGVKNLTTHPSVPSDPTGVVWNGTAGSFLVGGKAAIFIFDTEDGGILGWNGGPAATLEASGAAGAAGSAVFKGLAIAASVSAPLQGPLLYATDFRNARVDVYNAQWQPVSVPGGFVDPSLPAGYAPFGIQNIGGLIFVTYAAQDATTDNHDEVDGRGLGVIDEFDTAGNLLARVAQGGDLNAPWGLAQAPASFGSFGGDLLAGNFGDGQINAFEQRPDGSFQQDGTLQSASGGSVAIDGLWSLQFGSGATNNGSTDTLFFTAGPNGENDGLFGTINAANIQCDNQQLSGHYRSVTVVVGAACTLLAGSGVSRDVQVEQGATLIDQGATIGHDLTASNPSVIAVSGGSVGHDVQINGLTGTPPAGGDNVVCNTSIAHDLSVQNGAATAGPFDIGDPPNCSAGNQVGHDLVVQNNAEPVDVSDNGTAANPIGHDLRVQDNRPGGATVSNNYAGHDATCQRNSPQTGNGNRAVHSNSCPT